jgi:hypothetical protein
MTPALISLLVGCGCVAAHVALTLVLLRLPGRVSPVVRHAASAAATHVTGVALAAVVIGPLPYWPAAAAAGFGAVCWLFAFSAVYKSVSLRILSRIKAAPGNRLPFGTVTTDYVLPEFAARIGVLQTMGCAALAGDGFTLTPKGRATADRITAVQRLCGIERSGLYGSPDESARRAA